MKPFFFGPRASPLFGVLASPARSSKEGAVLCYPGPQEYNQSHWAFRKLSAQLARAGVHALRFDYTGTGDSAGEMAQGTLDGWVNEIKVASEELKDAAGVKAPSLIGMRLGAALAYRAATKTAVPQLILWDPVVSGGSYLDELWRRDEEENLQLLHKERSRERNELLGFAFPRHMRVALTSLDLLREPAVKAKKVWVLGSTQKREYLWLAEALQKKGVDAVFRHVPEEGATNAGVREAANLSSKMLAAIVELLTPAPLPNVIRGATA